MSRVIFTASHTGTQEANGLLSWRRRVNGYRRIYRYDDDTPPILSRSRCNPFGDCHRRIPPQWARDWANSYGFDPTAKFRGRLMVVGRGDTRGFNGGGPVGRFHRGAPRETLR